MTQKAVLRGEVGARAWRVCGQTREEIWAGVCGSKCLGESAYVVKPVKAWVLVAGSAFFVVVLLHGGCARHRVTPVCIEDSS